MDVGEDNWITGQLTLGETRKTKRAARDTTHPFKGADSTLVDHFGNTALMIARERQQTAAQQVLESYGGPRELIHEYAERLRVHNPDPPSALRKKLIEVASGINPPPAIPDGARTMMTRGATLLKNSSDRSTLFSAVEEFQNAVDLAPWWPDAYFNYASALEAYGDHDAALTQLQFYLEFKLSPKDAADARQRMAQIQTEEETARAGTAKSLAEASLKYVSGGAQRVVNGPDSWWPTQGIGMGKLYAYYPSNSSSATDPNLANVFLMTHDCYVAVLLEAQPNPDASYSSDSLFVAAIVGDKVWGRRIPFGSLAESVSSGQCDYKVSASERGPGAVVTVTEKQSGAAVALPVRDLYAARLENVFHGGELGPITVGDKHYWVTYQGGTQTAALFFSDAMVSVRKSAAVDPTSFVPTWVIPLDHNDHALGSTGYSLRWQGTSWKLTR